MRKTPWLMTQTWNNLLFAHWRVDQRQLRASVPEPFDIDLFDGDTWVGVVPFEMTNVGLGDALENTVALVISRAERPYLRACGRSVRVCSFSPSLDAGRRLPVAAARRFLNLHILGDHAG